MLPLQHRFLSGVSGLLAPERNRKRCILVLTAKTAVQDFEVVSTLDDTYKNGIFKLDVNVTNHTAANKNVTVTYELLDADKKVVTSAETPCNVSADGKKYRYFQCFIKQCKDLDFRTAQPL